HACRGHARSTPGRARCDVSSSAGTTTRARCQHRRRAGAGPRSEPIHLHRGLTSGGASRTWAGGITMVSDLRLSAGSDASALVKLRRRAGAWLAGCGASTAEALDLVVALEEAVINSIEHGRGVRSTTVEVRGRYAAGVVELRVRDFG